MRLRFGLMAEVCERKVAKSPGRQYLVTLFIYRSNVGSSVFIDQKNTSWISHCFCWPLTFSRPICFGLCRDKSPARCRCSHRTALSTRSLWCWPSWAWVCPTTAPNRWRRRSRPSPRPEGTFHCSDRGKRRASNEGKRCSNEAETQTSSSRTKLVTPHSHSRTTTLNFWDPFHHGQRFRGRIKSFLYFSVVQTLMGRVFSGTARSGVLGRTGFVDGFGWPKTCCLSTGFDH